MPSIIYDIMAALVDSVDALFDNLTPSQIHILGRPVVFGQFRADWVLFAFFMLVTPDISSISM